MKCIPIHIHGLSGTLVRIRRGLALQNTWIFKDSLGLFCRTSQREWSGPLSPDALSLTLTFATLLDYHTLRLSPSSDAIYVGFFFCSTPHPLCHNFHVLFRYHRASNLPALSHFCGLGAAETDEGMSTCLFSFSALRCPVSGLPACGGGLRCGRWRGSWFFFRSNHSQRTEPWFDLGFNSRVVFFTSAMWMSPQTHPLHFWSNLHHMPLKGDEPTGRRAFP